MMVNRLKKGERHMLYGGVGQKIDQLALALQAKYGTMTMAMQHIADATGYGIDTVYDWRKGTRKPNEDTLRILISIGKKEADLSRKWAEELTKTAKFVEGDSLLKELWGPKEIRNIPSNLPVPSHTFFVGRQTEIARLLSLLSPRHAAHMISIDGIGGVGKTVLALEAAYRCLRASTGDDQSADTTAFDAILFVSAKQESLTPGGILSRRMAQKTLTAIFEEIARTLDRPEIFRSSPDEQTERAKYALERQSTLLVVDNLETMDDRETILEFLYDLAPQVKVIITTRERALQYSPIRLEGLPERESLELISLGAENQGIFISKTDTLALYQSTSGNPAAMNYCVGQIAWGYPVKRVLENLSHREGDVARFMFKTSIEPLRNTPAHHLLLALSVFSKFPLREAVIYVAGLSEDPIEADQGLVQLQKLSLITQREGYVEILSLTREYALAELAMFPNFEKVVRERWIQWYMDFTRDNGGEDWKEWHIQYDRVEEEWENLLALFEWCRAKERYDDLAPFWSDYRVSEFANIYGYWSDRIEWLEWISRAAERRGDWAAYVKSAYELAWTFTWLGGDENLEQAFDLLTQAWKLRDHVGFTSKAWLADHFAVYYLRKKEYEEALRIIEIEEKLVQDAEVDEIARLRQWIPVPYYRGITYFEKEEYEKAKQDFLMVQEKAEQINWQRSKIYAQNWIADICILQDELDKAEELLRDGLLISERNKDKRRSGYYQRSFAHLEKKRENIDLAREWAMKSQDSFARLGMQPETDEMRGFLESLRKKNG